MKSTMMMMIEWMFLIKTYRIEICSSYQFTSLIISTQISPLSDWLNTNVSICYPPLLHSPLSNGGRGEVVNFILHVHCTVLKIHIVGIFLWYNIYNITPMVIYLCVLCLVFWQIPLVLLLLLQWVLSKSLQLNPFHPIANIIIVWSNQSSYSCCTQKYHYYWTPSSWLEFISYEDDYINIETYSKSQKEQYTLLL